MEFPIVKTKVEGLNKKFNLIDPPKNIFWQNAVQKLRG